MGIILQLSKLQVIDRQAISVWSDRGLIIFLLSLRKNLFCLYLQFLSTFLFSENCAFFRLAEPSDYLAGSLTE